MLSSTLKENIKEYLMKAEPNKALNLGKEFSVDFLAQGEYNINFTVENNTRKYVFRVNTGSQLGLEKQITYEYNALKALEVSSVTPKVYYCDDSKSQIDYGILVMEFLKGNPLDYSKDLSKAAEIFSRIHSIDTKAYENNFIEEDKLFTARVKEASRLLKEFFNSSLVNIELKKYFYRLLEWADNNAAAERYFVENSWRVINNTEVNSHNFIIGDKNSFLIDWEKPVISDPCQDITQFLAPTTTLWKSDYLISEEEKASFYKKYSEGMGIKEAVIVERVERYMPYLLLRALSWCAYAYVEYQREDKEIKNMDTFEKIKQYLDIDFMEKLLRPYTK